jgi:hypothetical protein
VIDFVLLHIPYVVDNTVPLETQAHGTRDALSTGHRINLRPVCYPSDSLMHKILIYLLL